MRRRNVFWFEILEELGSVAFRALMTTLCWRFVDEYKIIDTYRRHHQLIWAFWHGQMAVPAFVGRDRYVRILISTHQDGEFVARLCRGLRFEPIRGSTTRGGVEGLRELARTAKRRDLAITPDGPLGPREKVQPGAVLLAQVTGRPIQPIAGAFRPGKNLRSWDRFMIPCPFGRASAVAGDSIVVPENASSAERLEYAERLEKELKRVTALAEEACRSPWRKHANLKTILWK